MRRNRRREAPFGRVSGVVDGVVPELPPVGGVPPESLAEPEVLLPARDAPSVAEGQDTAQGVMDLVERDGARDLSESRMRAARFGRQLAVMQSADERVQVADVHAASTMPWATSHRFASSTLRHTSQGTRHSAA